MPPSRRGPLVRARPLKVALVALVLSIALVPAAGALGVQLHLSGDRSTEGASAPTSSAAPAVVSGPDLAVSKSDSVDPATLGTTFQYSVVVSNVGTARANDIVVKDALPAGVTYVSASGASCSHAGGVVTCTRNNLNAGSSFTVVIVVNPATTGVWTNRANATISNGDVNAANNEDTETTTIRTAAPTGLSCVAGPSGVTLDWGDVAQATGYNVYRRTGESGDFVLLASVTASQHLDGTAAVGQSYTYRVTALSSGGESAPSEPCTVASVPEFPTLLAGALALVGATGAFAWLRRRT